MPKRFTIKNDNLYYGGTYCNSLREQANVLAKLCNNTNTNCIQKYTDDSYYNFYLRGNAELKPENFDEASNVIQTILDLFDKIQRYTPKGFIYLYRGVDVPFDQAINDSGFMSFSADLNIAKAFGPNIVRIILCHPFKYQILPLEHVTSSKKEYEVLLAPGRGQFFPHSEQKKCNMKTYVYVPSDAKDQYKQTNMAQFPDEKLKEEKQSMLSFFSCFSKK